MVDRYRQIYRALDSAPKGFKGMILGLNHFHWNLVIEIHFKINCTSEVVVVHQIISQEEHNILI